MRSKFVPILVLLLVAAMVLPSLPAQARQDKVEITLWHMEEPTNRVERIQTLIDEFNAAHPEIEVKQEPQNWGEIYTKAPAAIAAGNAPELLFAIPDFTPILKDLGALQPVEDFVAELDAEHPFYPATVEQYTYDDHTWAVPLYNMSQNLWYRKSVLEAAGVEVPTTWDEWLAAAEALTTDAQYGVGLPAAKNLYTDQVMYDLMIGAGASEIYNDDGTLRFNNPETVEAYDMYNQLLQYSPVDSPNWAWGEAEACFANRTCAMVIQFTVITTYDTQAEGDAEDLGVAPIPYKEGVEDPGTIAYANAVMLLTDDPAKKEAAETFISWLLQPENYGRFLNMEPGLFLPVTEDGATADSFWEDPLVVKYQDQVQTMIENSTSGRLFGFTSGNTFPSIASISAQNLLAQTLQLVAIDGQSPADAVAEGQSLMESAIED
ncbi:ABC transporter substrate-binding protein [Aggregatilinea lenta]|uniref:ABC transporter substrate-binding protein n=1 Tax=Aggregatilinea lenta TaxID=913108 RepID=UPI000E5ABD57|nr:ABC transporter substrate-binding protein [Aggregatilinea lenta]